MSEISVDINLCAKSGLITNKTKFTKIFIVGTDRCIIFVPHEQKTLLLYLML